MNYVLFNPLSHAGSGMENYLSIKDKLIAKFGNVTEVNVTEYNPEEFFPTVTKEDTIIVIGGDGTLNIFANNIKKYNCEAKAYYAKGGNGNDFYTDVFENEEFISLEKYLENLPTITVNGKTQYYINGIGYGIDGMCCEIAEKMKAEGKTDINYAGLSIKLLLHGYKCPLAKVTVDDKEYSFKKVWLCSAMNGRYYGGGMKIAPNQNRLSDELSLSVIHNAGKLRTLMIFPKIFKGEHVKNKKMTTILTGKNITVEFSHPMALQIDGEVVSNVTSYSVKKAA